MRDLISKLVTGFVLIFITILTVLYSEGWRIPALISRPSTGSVNIGGIVKTGMLAVRSIPTGAKIYLDSDLITATDDTISSLKPGKYDLNIKKEGYEPWKKQIEVYPELVTDITAVLILQSPRLEPLTSSDVKAFTISNNQNIIAFITQNQTKPGIWVLPLSQAGMNLFKSDAYPLIPDTQQTAPSLGEGIKWSPDDKEVLVKMNEKGYLLYRMSASNTVESVESINDTSVLDSRWTTYWHQNFLLDKLPILNAQKIPQEIISNIDKTYGQWSPDSKKFFIFQPSDKPGLSNVTVYNTETPLPVGEKRIYSSLIGIDEATTKIYWYSDSYHLILVEGSADRKDYYVVSLMRIDGTNKTVIYTGNLASNEAYSTPAGDKIVVLTSLKANTPNNLYSISIR